MCSASVKELIEVVKYFRDEFDDLWRAYLKNGNDVGTRLMTQGMEIVNSSQKALAEGKRAIR